MSRRPSPRAVASRSPRPASSPAYSRTTFKLDTEAPSPFTATTLSIDNGVGIVEQEVQGPLGESIAPCASNSSDHWYFAAGKTDATTTMLLSLYNPFPGDAIADLRFATDQGPTSPDAYQGLVIPGHGVAVVNVGEKVRIRSAIATSVNVRAGRLVVDKLQLQAGTGPAIRGLSLVLGATAAGTGRCPTASGPRAGPSTSRSTTLVPPKPRSTCRRSWTADLPTRST